MLQFRDCLVCGESHALRPDGRMSIHTNARGERCEEPGTSTPVEEARERRFAAKRSQPATGPVRGGRRHEPEERTELDEAFDVAADKRHRRDDRPARGLDRRIYATEGYSVVRGGSPGHGKRS